MPAPASTAELADIIVKSGVVEEPRLAAYLAKLGKTPADPAELSGLMIRDGLLTYFQAEQLLQGKWKRFFIGKYKVLEKLGVGGMGQVFLCEHKLMKRRVAVKVLPAAKAQEPAALERFYREARAVAAVDHPNIVRAYDIDEDGGLHFLVMEFVDGSNLHDIVKKFGPMELTRACHYIYGAAVGLHHAGEMGLIHRDIKPANILVDRGGTVKILDLGLARFFNPDEDDLLTKKFDENVLGTADFLAPEQALDSTAVDARADMYGLGGTFYYMLTGSPPFPDGTVAQKLLWHQTKEPRAIRDLRPEVPPQLAAILTKMLAKNPDMRFQSPAELMTALGPWVQTPIGPPPAHEMPQFSAAAIGTQRTGSGSGAPLNTGSATLSSRGPSTPLYTPSTAVPPKTPAPGQPAARAAIAPPPPLPPMWDSIGADTLANAQADTRRDGSNKDRSSGSSARQRPRSNRDKARGANSGGKRWIFVLVGLALLAIAAGVLVAVRPWESKEKADTNKSTNPVAESGKWYVSTAAAGPNPNATRKTLADAVKSARSGDTIVILDDRLEGPSVVVPASVKNLRIEAGNSTQSVTWLFKPEGPSAAQAVLDIRAEGVTVVGLAIDANGQQEVGVQVSGFCSGTTLERLAVRGAKSTAFRLYNVDASDEKPVRLTGCRASGIPSGVALASSAGDGKRLTNRGIVVEACRFDNLETALRLDGPAEGVVFRNNRVFAVARAIQGPAELAGTERFRVIVERNTIHTAREAGLVLSAALTVGKHDLLITRNLFVSTPALTAGPSPAAVKSVDNARDKASKEGPIPLKALEVDVTFPAPNPADDATFLRAPNKPGVFGAD